MKRFLKVVQAFDRLIDYFAALGSVLIIGMMLIVSLEVVMRYVLHRPQIWVVEVSEYMLVWLTFLGAAWILRVDGHVKVDILLARLNPRVQVLCGVISSIMGAAICLVLLIYGVRVVWDLFLNWEIDPKSQIGMAKGPLLTIIPACSFLLLIQFVRRSLLYLEEWGGKGEQAERR